MALIAHPKSIKDDDIVFDLIRHGAQGLEVYHPIHADADTKKYSQMAESKNFLFLAERTGMAKIVAQKFRILP